MGPRLRHRARTAPAALRFLSGGADGGSADVVDRIARRDAGRDVRLLPRKYKRMARDPFAFYRATAHLFYARLDPARLPVSPLGWMTGDLHTENFGVQRDRDGRVFFDQNDFDESALAPAGLDLVRLIASVLIGTGMVPGRSAALAEGALAAYAAALATGTAVRCDIGEADGPAADLLRHAAAQTRGDLLAARTVPSGGSRAFVDDAKRYLPVVGEDPAAIAAAVLSAGGAGLRSVEDVKVRVAGLGSLGLPRYGIVARTSAEPHGYTLLDVKAAIASCATAAAGVPQPPFADEATRIVTIRARAQAAPLATLTALGIGQHPFVMRELQPEEDRIDMTALDSDTAVAQALAAMARAAASAHLHGAGQAGAAPLDTWVAFGRSLDKPALLAAATSAAEGSQADYRTFRQAWDDRDARLPRKRG